MLLLLLLLAVACGTVVAVSSLEAAGRPVLRRRGHAQRSRPSAPPGVVAIGGSVGAGDRRALGHIEAALAAGLVIGELTPAEYRESMAWIARCEHRLADEPEVPPPFRAGV